MNLYDGLGHAHALAGEALHRSAFGVIDHAGELRGRQPVQGVVWTEDEYAGRVGHRALYSTTKIACPGSATEQAAVRGFTV
jgi:hypothetical protein